MATRKSKEKKQRKTPLIIRTFAITAENDESLENLAVMASDRLGWKVSSSAIMRALLAFVGEQGETWIAREILSRIEDEIAKGRVWGTKR